MPNLKRFIALLILPIVLSSQVSFAQNCTLAEAPKNEFSPVRDATYSDWEIAALVLARDAIKIESIFAEIEWKRLPWIMVLAGALHVVSGPLRLNPTMRMGFAISGYGLSKKYFPEYFYFIKEKKDRAFKVSENNAFMGVAKFAQDSAVSTLQTLISAAPSLMAWTPNIAVTASSLATGFVSKTMHTQIVAFRTLVGQHTVPAVFGWEEATCVVCFSTFGEENCFRFGLRCGHTQTCRACLTPLAICPVCRAPR